MRQTPLIFFIAPVAACLLLNGCESPAASMTPQQVSQLSNDQLCDLKNSYPWEQNTELEVGKRNLICDPAYNQCLGQGNKPDSPNMTTCINQLRENWALQEELGRKEQQLRTQQIQNTQQQTLNSLINSRPRQQVIYGPNGYIVQQY